MRLLRSTLAALGALALLVGSVAAADQSTVAGSFRYSPFADEPTREVSVRAHGRGDDITGSWEWTNLLDGTTRAGTITCLVVDGDDAWLAGPETSSSGTPRAGVFFRIHDGGQPGATEDSAIAFIGDPGQTLGELEAWCQSTSTDIDVFPIDTGNLVVYDAR